MEVTLRELITMIHGMLFGGFFLLALFGMFVLLLDRSSPDQSSRPIHTARAPLADHLSHPMVIAGWAAVLSGAYIIYPWYRAVAPLGPTSRSILSSSLRRTPPPPDGTTSAWSGRSTSRGSLPWPAQWSPSSCSNIAQRGTPTRQSATPSLGSPPRHSLLPQSPEAGVR